MNIFADLSSYVFNYIKYSKIFAKSRGDVREMIAHQTVSKMGIVNNFANRTININVLRDYFLKLHRMAMMPVFRDSYGLFCPQFANASSVTNMPT